MKLTDEFVVDRPIEAVWGLFEDVAAVAQCLPGAELTADRGDGVYAGRVSVKLGPLNPTFEGEATAVFESDTRSIRLNGSGIDRKGGSRGRVAVVVELRETAETTVVAVDANVTLSGAAARFGRTGLMEEMASRLITEFVDCLETKLTAGTETEAAAVQAEEVRGLTLLLASLGRWFTGLLRRVFRRA